MTRSETVSDVTAEMRRMMPNACAEWADRIDRAARPNADSLRDWFAGQALAGLTGKDMPPSMGDNLEKYMRAVAVGAYTFADAMIAARGDA